MHHILGFASGRQQSRCWPVAWLKDSVRRAHDVMIEPIGPADLGDVSSSSFLLYRLSRRLRNG
jgi:hypothetical protein